MHEMSDTNALAHWLRTKKLMLATLGLGMTFSICVPMLVVPLNKISIPYLDLPLGFFMTTQGALIAFLLMVHVFARRQDRIDRDHFSAGGC
jgi:putative solute:sodium symporter small subunit